jgi:hypothetical protein
MQEVILEVQACLLQQLMRQGYDALRVVVAEQPDGDVLLLDGSWPLTPDSRPAAACTYTGTAEAGAEAAAHEAGADLVGVEGRESGADQGMSVRLQISIGQEGLGQGRSERVLSVVVLAGHKNTPARQQQQQQQERSLQVVRPRATAADLMLAQMPLLLLPKAVVDELEVLLEEAVEAWHVTESYAYQQLLLPVVKDWALLLLGGGGSSSSNVASSSSTKSDTVRDREGGLGPSSSINSSSYISKSSTLGGLSGEAQQAVATALAGFFRKHQLDLCDQQLMSIDRVESSGVAAPAGSALADLVVGCKAGGTDPNVLASAAIGEGIRGSGDSRARPSGASSSSSVAGLVKRSKEHSKGCSSSAGESSFSASSGLATAGGGVGWGESCVVKQQGGWQGPTIPPDGTAVGSEVGVDTPLVMWKAVLLGFSAPRQEAAYRQWKARQLQQHDAWVMLLFVMATAVAAFKAAWLCFDGRSSSEVEDSEAALLLLLRHVLLAALIGVQALSHILVWLAAATHLLRHLVPWRGWILASAQLTILLAPIAVVTYSSRATTMRTAMQSTVEGYQASPLLMLAFRHLLHPVLLQSGLVANASCALAAVLAHDVAFPLPLWPVLRPVVALVGVPVQLTMAAWLEHTLRRKFAGTAWVYQTA